MSNTTLELNAKEKTAVGTEQKPKKISKYAFVIGAIFLIGIIAVILGLTPSVQYTYDTTPLQKTSLDASLMASGVVKSSDSRSIYALSTLQILSVNVKEGDQVAQGDELAVLDTSNLQLDIKQTKLAIQAAEATLSNAERSNKNTAANASSAVKTAKADLETAQRNYNDLNAQLEAVNSSNYTNIADNSSAAAAVRSAKADLDLAQRNHDTMLGYLPANTQIASAGIDLNAATKKYNDLLAGSGNYAVQGAQLTLTNAQAALASTDPTNTADYAKAQTAVTQAQLALDAAQATLDSNLAAALQAMQKAQVAYDSAIKTAGDSVEASNTALTKARIAYENALKALRDNVKNASAALTKSQGAYNIAVSNNAFADGQNVDLGTISLEQQKVLLEKQEKTFNEATMKAPVSGTITYLSATVGQPASGLMFMIEDTNQLLVSVSLNESDIGTVKVGQKVSVVTDATAGEGLPGTVSRISAAAQKTTTGATNSSSAYYTVEVKIDKPDNRIKIGMNARLSILTEHKDGVYAVPIKAIRKSSDGTSIQVLENSKDAHAEPRLIAVKTGIESSSMVEIFSDELTDGMLVVTETTVK